MNGHPHPDDSTRPAIAAYVDTFARLLHSPIPLPDISRPAPALKSIDRTRPLALIVSPHPDDECLTGGLALRLRQEAGFEVLNVPATLGSKLERRSERWNELCHACHRLGFALLDPDFNDRLPITPARRNADPASWARDADCLAALFDHYQPRIVFCPHERDGSATHIGVHWLVRDALQRHANAVWLAQTEFWGTIDQPNTLVELDGPDVVTLIEALTCHRGEIARNPIICACRHGLRTASGAVARQSLVQERNRPLSSTAHCTGWNTGRAVSRQGAGGRWPSLRTPACSHCRNKCRYVGVNEHARLPVSAA